jgi:hypothetical protein
VEHQWNVKSQAFVNAKSTDANTRSRKVMRMMSMKMDISTQNKSDAKMQYKPVDLPEV